jgi:hypothetical protein
MSDGQGDLANVLDTYLTGLEPAGEPDAAVATGAGTSPPGTDSAAATVPPVEDPLGYLSLNPTEEHGNLSLI